MISFIWIKSSEEISLNLENGKKFFFNYNENSLNVKDEENLPFNFFPSNIDINLIVGKNGSGKSHIIFTLIEILNEGLIGEYLIVFKKNNSYFYIANLQKNNINIINNNLKLEKTNIDSIVDFKILYINNIFLGENNYYSENLKNYFIDKSLNSLIKKNNTVNLSQIFIDDILQNLIHDEYRNVFQDFINRLPHVLSLAKKISPNRIQIDDLFDFEDDYHNRVNEFLNNFHDFIKNFKTKYDFKDTNILVLSFEYNQIIFINQFFYFLWVDLYQYYKNNNDIQKILEDFFNKYYFLESDFLIKINFINNMLDNENFISYPNIKEIKKIIESIKTFTISSKYNPKPKKINKYPLYIDYINDKNLLNIYLDFQSSFNDIPFINENFDFHWEYTYSEGLSSGELFYFRIYNEIYSIDKQRNESKKILLLLDEYELYLHPELQRKSINDLINNLSITFSHINFQIIICSNSPFLLSDIPNSKTTYLENRRIIDKQEQTFGANIHSLLKDNFFMESTIGEYSKKKINEAIKILNKPFTIPPEEISVNEKKYLEGLIPIIGDSIIKNKLQAMYLKLYPNEIDEIEIIKKLYQEEDISLENSNKDKLKSKIEAILRKLENYDD